MGSCGSGAGKSATNTRRGPADGSPTEVSDGRLGAKDSTSNSVLNSSLLNSAPAVSGVEVRVGNEHEVRTAFGNLAANGRRPGGYGTNINAGPSNTGGFWRIQHGLAPYLGKEGKVVRRLGAGLVFVEFRHDPPFGLQQLTMARMCIPAAALTRLSDGLPYNSRMTAKSRMASRSPEGASTGEGADGGTSRVESSDISSFGRQSSEEVLFDDQKGEVEFRVLDKIGDGFGMILSSRIPNDPGDSPTSILTLKRQPTAYSITQSNQNDMGIGARQSSTNRNDLNNGENHECIVVDSVVPGSSAEHAGIRPGMSIIAIDNNQVRTLPDAEEGVRKAPARCRMAIFIPERLKTASC